MQITAEHITRIREHYQTKYGLDFESDEEVREHLEMFAKLFDWLLRNDPTNKEEEPGVSGVACQNASAKS